MKEKDYIRDDEDAIEDYKNRHRFAYGVILVFLIVTVIVICVIVC